MKTLLRLPMLCPGEKALIKRIDGETELLRRLMELGLTEGSRLECVGRSPGRNGGAYLVRGAVLAIRDRDCGDIIICRL